MREQPQRLERKRTVILWSIRLIYGLLILGFLRFFYEISGCGHGPVIGKDNLKYGNFYPFCYQEAPFSCIYVGLTTNAEESFQEFFTRFAKTNGIYKVTKHFTVYSGRRLANYMSDHVAFFVYTGTTAQISEVQAKLRSEFKEQVMEQALSNGGFEFAFWWSGFWPTNTSRVTKGGSDVLAQYTGSIKMVSFDEQYSPQDFKALVISLTNSLHLNWPDHTVEAFIYEGK